MTPADDDLFYLLPVQLLIMKRTSWKVWYCSGKWNIIKTYRFFLSNYHWDHLFIFFWWLEVFSRGQSWEDLTASVEGTVKPPLHQLAGQAGAQIQGQQAGGGGHWLHHNLHQREEVNQARFTEPLLCCTRVREVNRCSRRLWSIQIHIKCSNWSFTLVFQI